ncbi:cupin domain-containing protein [Pseudonocardia xinjiangensis]|nr:cupin domain-containing protein [Pseudonocardia xinjiangensis]
MNSVVKMGLVSVLAFGSVMACGTGTGTGTGQAPASPPAAGSAPAADGAHDQGGVHRIGAGSVTRVMTQDLPDVPGKEGMIEIVDSAPGEASQVHRHNCDLFVYVLEGSVVTQLKGGNPQTINTGGAYYESPTDIHLVSRNASATQPAKLAVFYVKAKGTPPTETLPEGTK